MTSLTKAIARRARDPQVYSAGKRRRIVVMLEPGDVIAMRLEGERTTFRAEIKSVYYQMAQWYAAAEGKRRKKQRELRKKGLA